MTAKKAAPTITPEQLAASRARRLRDLLADYRSTFDTVTTSELLARRRVLRAEIEGLQPEVPILSAAEIARLAQ